MPFVAIVFSKSCLPPYIPRAKARGFTAVMIKIEFPSTWHFAAPHCSKRSHTTCKCSLISQKPFLLLPFLDSIHLFQFIEHHIEVIFKISAISCSFMIIHLLFSFYFTIIGEQVVSYK